MRTYTTEELRECPTIRVTGKDWPIPILGPRQNRRIVPLLSQLRGITLDKLDTEKMDAMYNCIYWALSRAHEIKEADFLDWDIPVLEAVACLHVISKQTGLMTDKKEEVAGEAPATTGGVLIGTSSSPELSPPQE